MIGFFTETLGAKLIEIKKFGTADGATLDLNGSIINLRLANEKEKVFPGSTRLQYGYHHLGLEVENLEAAYNDLIKRGFRFTIPPKELGDMKIAFFEGPDQIIIELVESLSGY